MNIVSTVSFTTNYTPALKGEKLRQELINFTRKFTYDFVGGDIRFNFIDLTTDEYETVLMILNMEQDWEL